MLATPGDKVWIRTLAGFRYSGIVVSIDDRFLTILDERDKQRHTVSLGYIGELTTQGGAV
jgi:hypothetical protein